MKIHQGSQSPRVPTLVTIRLQDGEKKMTGLN